MRKIVIARLAAGALPFLVASSGCTQSTESSESSSALDVEPAASASAAESSGGWLASAPAVARVAANRYDVAVQGWANTLWRRSLIDGNWGAWEEIDNDGTTTIPVTMKPAIVAQNGQVDVLVRHNDGSLWTRHHNGRVWGKWKSLGGWLADGPAVVSDAPGHIDVFVQGGGQTLFQKSFRQENVTYGFPLPGGGWIPGNDGWSDWKLIPGTITSAPSATSWSSGRIDVFARGADRTLLHTYSNDTGATFAGFEHLGGSLSGAPTATTRGINTLQIYALQSTNVMTAIGYTPGGWTGWGNVGIFGAPSLPVTSDLAAVAEPGSTCDHLFARDSSNALWHRGCGEISDIVLTNHATGTRFESDLPKGQNAAFNGASLGAVATESVAAGSWTNAALVDARWPRELLVLNGDVATNRSISVFGGSFAVPSWNAGEMGINYARVTGYPGSGLVLGADLATFASAVEVPWQVKAARLIDHGDCATKIPFFWDYVGGTATNKNALLELIDLGLYKAMSAVASKQGVSFYRTMARIEPSFMSGQTADLSQSDDGFTLWQKLRFYKSTDFGDATLDLDVRMSYRFGLKDGVPTLEPVGDLYVNPDSNFLYDFGKLLSDVGGVLGGALGGIVNVIPATAGADDWVNLVPPSVPSGSSVADLVRYQLATQVPAAFRAQALASMIPRTKTGPWQAVGTCSKTDDPAVARASCYAQRTGPLQLAVQSQLTASGMSTADASAKAAAMVSALRPEAFDCLHNNDPYFAGTDQYNCYFHPVAKRMNVLPTRAEIVWYDGAPSPEMAVAQLFLSAAQKAQVCSVGAAEGNVGSTTLPLVDALR